MKKIVFLIGSLALFLIAGAQETSVGRIEISVEEGDTPFEVIPLGRLGVLVVNRQNEIASVASGRRGELPWRGIRFYDENLRLRWHTQVQMASAYRYVGYRLEEDSVRFALTVLSDKVEKTVHPAFLEVSVCLADGRYTCREHSIEIPLNKVLIPEVRMEGRFWYFLAVQKSEYFYGRFDREKDTLYRYPIASAKDFDCCDWQTDSLGAACFLFRDARIDNTDLFFVAYSADGEEKRRATLSAPHDIRFTDARLIRTGEDEVLVGGSWNLARSRQTVSNYDRGTETMGLFALRYERGTVRNFWMKPYLEYPLLDTLLGGKEQFKLAQARQRASGRTILPDYLCNLYFSPFNGKFALTGEIYERVVTTTTETSYDFYGRMMPYTRVEFEGFRYQNAFFSLFDSLGNNRANSVFDLEHMELYNRLFPFTVVAENADGALLYAYINQGTVHYRNTLNLAGIGPLRNFRPEPLITGDRLQKTWNEEVVAWYPGNLLVYGYQQVLNTRRKGKSRQPVFYMHKVIVS